MSRAYTCVVNVLLMCY